MAPPMNEKIGSHFTRPAESTISLSICLANLYLTKANRPAILAVTDVSSRLATNEGFISFNRAAKATKEAASVRLHG